MIIAISGSVGVGKTTISNLLSKETDYEVIHLNEIAKKYKIKDIDEIKTFDFDIEKLKSEVEQLIDGKDNLILEGHFAHLLDPQKIDLLVVINRDLKYLTKEYDRREYPESKKKDNLEVEAFNLCFYEALEEGFDEGQVISFFNDTEPEDLVSKIVNKI